LDFSCSYCPARRDLEEHTWALVSRLSLLTSRLLKLVGDHGRFTEAKVECVELRGAIAQSSANLAAHRAFHGC